MNKGILSIVILVVTFIKSYGQEFPLLNNEYDSKIKEFIESERRFKDYDFILSKYERSYWFAKTNYKMICFKKNTVDIYAVTSRKNGKYKFKRIKNVSYVKHSDLIRSIVNTGVFNLTNEDLKTELNLGNGKSQVLSISDGVKEIIEIYNKGNYWGLSVYEAQNYYNFCRNKNLLIFIEACYLFDYNWDL